MWTLKIGLFYAAFVLLFLNSSTAQMPNLENVGDILQTLKDSGMMDQFEKEFEDLDVQTSVMEGAMSQTTATNIPTDSVDVLMKQAADEAGIELSHELPSAATNTIGTAQQVATSEQDELSQRLARLRQV